MASMRSHHAIVKAAGAEKIAEALGIPSIHTVRSWIIRNRIPAEHWAGVASHGWASLEELAALSPVETGERQEDAA